MFQLQTNHLILSPQKSWHASGLRLGPVPVPRPMGFGNWISGDVAVSHIYIWLVVSTPLKNISQLGSLFTIYGKIKNYPNHQPDTNVYNISVKWPGFAIAL